jgi:ABC-2 type transport system permease protein
MLNTIIKEMKELCSDKRIWIGILTVLIIIIIGTSYNVKNNLNTQTEQLKLGVINKDSSPYSELLLNYFNSSETFSSFITVKNGQQGPIQEAFEQGEIDVYLEIPEDFAKNMIKLEHSPITVTFNISDTSKTILFQNVLKSYEKYIAAVEANAVGLYEIMQQQGMEQTQIDETNRMVSIDLILTALGKEAFFSYRPINQFPSTTLIQYYLSSVLVMVFLYSGLSIGYQVLTEMKQGTFTRLQTTRTSLFCFLTAKVFVMVTVMTVASSIAVIVLKGSTINRAGILFCFALSMFSVCFAIFLCAFFNITQRYILVGNIGIFYFTVLGGGIIPIPFLPQNLLTLSKITPNYYMIQGIIHLTNGQGYMLNQMIGGFLFLSFLLFGIAVLLFQKRSLINDEA